MRNSTRYILMILGVLIVIIIMIVVFANINHPKNTKTTTQTTQPTSLALYADTDATVSYMVSGRINGDDQHRAINIIVSKIGRTVQIYSGYQGTIIKSQTTPNNQQAYQQFLGAIQQAGFLKQRVNPTVTNIEGQCSLGNRYIFSTTNVADAPSNLWSSNCSGNIGTWGGNYATVSQLFTLQIPNYNQFVSGTSL